MKKTLLLIVCLIFIGQWAFGQNPNATQTLEHKQQEFYTLVTQVEYIQNSGKLVNIGVVQAKLDAGWHIVKYDALILPNQGNPPASTVVYTILFERN